VPTPAFSTALAFYDGYRTARLPANLLQAQRDFFGAHTYERVDKPRGEFFHTNWTGRGGRVSSSTYNAVPTPVQMGWIIFTRRMIASFSW
jgi:6-phosphogluconate dehydrogenase